MEGGETKEMERSQPDAEGEAAQAKALASIGWSPVRVPIGIAA